MSRKMISFVVAIIMMVSVFTACGADNSNADKTNDVVSTEQSETSVVEKPSEPVKISWMDANPYAIEKMDALLLGLKDEANIEVEIEHVANNFLDVLKTKINSGDTPDVFQNLAGGDNKIYAEYSYDYTNEEIVKKFKPDAIEQCKYDGKIIGLPWNYQTYSLLYNKKVFADAGITQLPKTLKELEQVCETLKSKGVTPFGNGYKEYWVMKHIVSHFMGAEGKSPADIAADISSGKVKFADMKFMKNSFDFIDITLKYGKNKPLETGWEDIENSLAKGEVAMIHMGDWAEPVLKKVNPNVDVGFLPVPVSDNPSDAKVMSNVSWVWKVSSQSKNIDAAKKALEYFLTSEKGMEFNAKDYGSVSCTNDAEFKPTGLLAVSAYDYVTKGEYLPWPQTAWPDGFEVKLGNLYQAYAGKDKTRDQVLAELTDNWLRLIK